MQLYNKNLQEKFPTCENKTALNGNILYPSHIAIFNHNNKNYCFTDTEFSSLIKTKINPYNNVKFSEKEIGCLNAVSTLFDEYNEQTTFTSFLLCLENKYRLWETNIDEKYIKNIDTKKHNWEFYQKALALYKSVYNKLSIPLKIYGFDLCLCIIYNIMNTFIDINGYHSIDSPEKYYKYCLGSTKNQIKDTEFVSLFYELHKIINFEIFIPYPILFFNNIEKLDINSTTYANLSRTMIMPEFNKFKYSTIAHAYYSLLFATNKIPGDKDIEECMKLLENTFHRYRVNPIPKINISDYEGVCYSSTLHMRQFRNIKKRRLLSDKSAYGKIYEVESETNERAVLKQSTENGLDTEVLEVALLKLIDHPNIVKIYYANIGKRIKDGGSSVDIYLEKADGDLHEFYKKRFRMSRIPENLLKSIVKQLLKGIQYCHQRNIVNCDIKTQNILFVNEKDGIRVVIADFGIGGIVSYTNFEGRLLCTPSFRAPEGFRVEREHIKPLDIWSIGCVILELLGNNLFMPTDEDFDKYDAYAEDDDVYLYRIFDILGYWDKFDNYPRIKNYTRRKKMRAISEILNVSFNISANLADFLDNIFIYDPVKRKTATQLLKHPFLN